MPKKRRKENGKVFVKPLLSSRPRPHAILHNQTKTRPPATNHQASRPPAAHILTHTLKSRVCRAVKFIHQYLHLEEKGTTRLDARLAGRLTIQRLGWLGVKTIKIDEDVREFAY